MIYDVGRVIERPVGNENSSFPMDKAVFVPRTQSLHVAFKIGNWRWLFLSLNSCIQRYWLCVGRIGLVWKLKAMGALM